MTAKDKLHEYRAKRNFEKTAEPSGGERSEPEGVAAGKTARFVVQKHDARRLHYDFRLEVDGVLKSWAVPKGPSMNPRDKRLAVMTEDHPLDYYDFEGTIPEGEYGAGSVIVWDLGGYENLTEKDGEPVDLGEAIEAGHFKVRLDGQKLKGSFAMTRTGGWAGARGEKQGDDESWLLVKMKGDEARQAEVGYDPVRTRPESALTGRTVEEMGPDRPAQDAGKSRKAPRARTLTADQEARKDGPRATARKVRKSPEARAAREDERNAAGPDVPKAPDAPKAPGFPEVPKVPKLSKAPKARKNRTARAGRVGLEDRP